MKSTKLLCSLSILIMASVGSIPLYGGKRADALRSKNVSKLAQKGKLEEAAKGTSQIDNETLRQEAAKKVVVATISREPEDKKEAAADKAVEALKKAKVPEKDLTGIARNYGPTLKAAPAAENPEGDPTKSVPPPPAPPAPPPPPNLYQPLPLNIPKNMAQKDKQTVTMDDVMEQLKNKVAELRKVQKEKKSQEENSEEGSSKAPEILADVLGNYSSKKMNDVKPKNPSEDSASGSEWVPGALDRLSYDIRDWKKGLNPENCRGEALKSARHYYVKTHFGTFRETIQNGFSEWYDNDKLNALLNGVLKHNWKEIFQPKELDDVIISMDLRTIYYTLWESFLNNLGDCQKLFKRFLREYCTEDGSSLDDGKVEELLSKYEGMDFSLNDVVRFEDMLTKLQKKLNTENRHEVEMILIYMLYQHGEFLRIASNKSGEEVLEFEKFHKNCQLAFNRDNLKNKFIEYFGEEDFWKYLENASEGSEDWKTYESNAKRDWEACKDIISTDCKTMQKNVENFFGKADVRYQNLLTRCTATQGVEVKRNGKLYYLVASQEFEFGEDMYCNAGFNIWMDCCIRLLFVDYAIKYGKSDLNYKKFLENRNGDLLSDIRGKRAKNPQGTARPNQEPGKLNPALQEIIKRGLFGAPENKRAENKFTVSEELPGELTAWLDKNGFTVLEVPGDGNCGIWASLVANRGISQEEWISLMRTYTILRNEDPNRGCPGWSDFESRLERPDLNPLKERMLVLREKSRIDGSPGEWIDVLQFPNIAQSLQKEVFVVVNDHGTLGGYFCKQGIEALSWEEFKSKVAKVRDSVIVYYDIGKQHYMPIVKK